MGCAARVSRLADKVDLFGHKAHPGADRVDRPLGGVALRVHHHRHINVVKFTARDQLLLTAEKGDIPPLAKLCAILDLHEFLCGNGEEVNVTVKLIRDGGKPHRTAEHRGDLCIVPAGVRRAAHHIRAGMERAADGIHLADHGYARVMGTAGERSSDTADRKTGAV